MEKRELDYLMLCALKLRKRSVNDKERNMIDAFIARVGVQYQLERIKQDEFAKD